MRTPGLSPAIELRIIHRTGTTLHTETIANNLLHDPNVNGIVLYARNISERKAFAQRLILPIGGWVLEKACRQTRCWHELYNADRQRPISVNLSA